MLSAIDKVTLYRTLTILAAMAAILIGCMVILHPFIPALLLATIFCLSTWPAFAWLEKRLNGGKTLAAALMTLLLAVCFLLPLVFLGSSMAEDFGKLLSQTMEAIQSEDGSAPIWIAKLPLVGLWFWYADVPAAELLGFLSFILSFVPGGFPLVLVPVALW